MKKQAQAPPVVSLEDRRKDRKSQSREREIVSNDMETDLDKLKVQLHGNILEEIKEDDFD